MKQTNEIIINLPINKVMDLFHDIDNIYKWQRGLKKFETIEGKAGEVGAKSKMTYDINGREMVLTETITVSNPPDEFSGTYEGSGVFTKIQNHFTKVDDNTTKWTAINEFEFHGFMKFMGALMPGMFHKQSQQLMEDFKAFAEHGTDVNAAKKK